MGTHFLNHQGGKGSGGQENYQKKSEKKSYSVEEQESSTGANLRTKRGPIQHSTVKGKTSLNSKEALKKQT